MKTTIAPIVLAVLASLPWTAQAAPQETTERRPTAIFSAPEKPVEGRMVLRNSTSDALATQTQGLLAARPDVRWRIIGERARAEGHHEQRSEERRVEKECVRTVRSRWSPEHKKKKTKYRYKTENL